MDTELIFRIITVVLFVAALVISISFRRRAEREGGQMRSSEGQGLVVVLRLLGLLVLLPLFGYIINPDWVAWARFLLPEWVRWSAVVVAVALLPLIYWIFASIGNNISPTQATRVNHQLVTHGPYRWVRHQLYSAGFVMAVCLTLITTLWWLGLGMVLPLSLLFRRTAKEEANLISTFGDAYREYMQRTGRFFPKLG
ncbi:MAG: isoprenylcysteine carboxylmethyltransferase family protein [Anaerolineales bacterium]